MGKYEKAGIEAIEERTLEFLGNIETAKISLKVLDTISDNSEELSVKHALLILEDAKEILLQLIGV